MAQHTPGPWEVFVPRANHNGKNQHLIMASDPSKGCVATAHRNVGDEPDAVEANARLIAAAPDLLAALKWAERALAPFSKEPAEKSGIAMIRAAIRRAEGKTDE